MQSLSPAEFDAIRHVVRDRSGVELGETRRFAIGSRVSRRARELGLTDATQYVSYLKMGAQRFDELDELHRLATLAETSFWRYPRQTEYLEKCVLPEMIERRRTVRRLRIWSAGCSTGQEPYTLAAIAHRVLGVRLADWDVRILATDISEQSLRMARQAAYKQESTHELSRELDAMLFEPSAGETRRIHAHLREMVSFSAHNLHDTFAASRLGRFEVISCRNVLRHFSEKSRGACLATLHARLEHDGVLLTGHRDMTDANEALFAPIGDADTQAWKHIG